MKRGYQNNFSDMHRDALYDKAGKERKANTIVLVLKDFFGDGLDKLKVLDIGASTGIIGNYLSNQFGSVLGIDIDQKAIDYANENANNPNLRFELGDAMALDIADDTFDVVICAHIYEHVPDSAIMMREIFRVLKPGGVCYFVAGNRFNYREQHYDLPLLSVIPRPLAHIYLRLAGKGSYYYEKHLSYWGLKWLAKDFLIHDYTKKSVMDPAKYGIDYMLAVDSAKYRLARFIADYAYFLFPTYIWLLQKPTSDAAQ